MPAERRLSFRRRLTAALTRAWYMARPPVWLWPLAPLAGVFAGLAGLRRLAWQCGMLQSVRLPVPVLVVGNLTVGGVGKTPLVMALARAFRDAGRRPGIVSRGHGGAAGRGRQAPRPVRADSLPAEVGDEPLLLAAQSACPVWVGRDRAATAQALLAAHPDVDLLLCDDGLQHYRLARDAEIVVFDGRGIGNGWRLPLGPLREPLARLAPAPARPLAALVFNGAPDARVCRAAPDVPAFAMQLLPETFYRLGAPACRATPAELAGRRLHAVAGIGDPARFFRTLSALGLEFTATAFPDHHVYTAADLARPPGTVLLMTEKDAVKCAGLDPGEAWVLPVRACLPPQLIDVLLEKINGRKAA
jgi:tetraacyldisaccharide 4'-kinase